MRKLTMFLCALFVGVASAMAQTAITGTVLSADDDSPIYGASVLVKGTNVSAITDADGRFSIKLPDGSNTVVVSYIGMEKTEAFARNGMVVKLSSTTTLEEVIVVGYGVQSREAKTGAVVQVSGDDLASIPATSVDQMLQGKMAGVQISSNNGQPGAATSIRIRGTSSINASNAPLYVVDGVPVMSGDISTGGAAESTNAIALINPSDIATITVLKDAAAASIYGSRAANGVILITTKSGSDSQGKARISARVRYGMTTLAKDGDYDPMDPETWVNYYRTAVINAGGNPDDPSSQYYMPMGTLSQPMTNWMDALTRTGSLQEYEVNAQGGNGKTNYYASASYGKNEGVTYASDFERIQMRVNVDSELNKWLKIGARVNGGYMRMRGESTNQSDSWTYNNPFFVGMYLPPTVPVYNEDGSYNRNIPLLNDVNALAYAFEKNEYDTHYKFNGSMYLEWKPIKQLTFKTNNSSELLFSRLYSYSPGYVYENQMNAVTTFDSQYSAFTTSNTGVYEDNFNEEHFLRVLVGQEYTYTKSLADQGSTQDVNPLIPYVTTGNQSYNRLYYSETAEKLLSFFGVVDYNYLNKYYLQASVRGDGSSLFGQNKQWGCFWSVGASWNMEKENFLKDVSWINQLKLRYSYGVNGNNGIGAYGSYALYSTLVNPYNGWVGLGPAQLPNPDLSWETNKAHNVGIDFRFWERFSGTFEYYHRTTEDMLLSTRIPYTTGFSSMMRNVGSIWNQGFEAQLDFAIFDRSDLHWSIGLNFSMNKSHVIDLGSENRISAGNGLYIVEGEQLMQFYLYDYAGVNPVNGEALWYNEAGEITNNFTDARRVYKGSPEPIATGGFNTAFNWNGIDFSASFEYKFGNYILTPDNQIFWNDGATFGGQQLAVAGNYWQNIGDTSVSPKPVANNGTNSAYTLSTRFLERGDYLRIKDMTLGYTLPQKWTKKAAMSNVRIYLSAYNLFTFHDVHTSMDPERGVSGTGLGLYPTTKSFVIGLDVTF